MVTKYIFIDECGDPEFYGNRGKLLVGQQGYQPILFEGMIITEDRKALRNAVINFQNKIKKDELYNSIYSVKSPNWFLHAKDDHPEVRAKFFELLRTLDGYKCFVVIGRKIHQLFTKKHNKSSKEFYFDVLYHLLKDRLNQEDVSYRLFLAKRQKTNQADFINAIERALVRDKLRRKKSITVNYKCDVIKSQEFPEMSIIDYLLWALQRYIIKKEKRFFDAVIEKYSLIIDLYDRESYSRNYFTKENKFGLEKVSDFNI